MEKETQVQAFDFNGSNIRAHVDVPLVTAEDGPRIESRIYCNELGINHTDWINDTAKKYERQLSQLGACRFKTDSKKRGGAND